MFRYEEILNKDGTFKKKEQLEDIGLNVDWQNRMQLETRFTKDKK